MGIEFPVHLRHPRPKIAEIQCYRVQFEPGDRILVRVHHRLDRDQKASLIRSVKKWAGTDVEVLIVDTTQMEISIEQSAINRTINPAVSICTNRG